MRRYLPAGGLVLGMLVAGWVGVLTWRAAGASQMSWQGWVAMILGTVFTMALAGGLMTLVFLSSRRGYDDDVASEFIKPSETDPEP